MRILETTAEMVSTCVNIIICIPANSTSKITYFSVSKLQGDWHQCSDRTQLIALICCHSMRGNHREFLVSLLVRNVTLSLMQVPSSVM